MFCPFCGTDVASNAAFCPHCGANLQDEIIVKRPDSRSATEPKTQTMDYQPKKPSVTEPQTQKVDYRPQTTRQPPAADRQPPKAEQSPQQTEFHAQQQAYNPKYQAQKPSPNKKSQPSFLKHLIAAVVASLFAMALARSCAINAANNSATNTSRKSTTEVATPKSKDTSTDESADSSAESKEPEQSQTTESPSEQTNATPSNDSSNATTDSASIPDADGSTRVDIPKLNGSISIPAGYYAFGEDVPYTDAMCQDIQIDPEKMKSGMPLLQGQTLIVPSNEPYETSTHIRLKVKEKKYQDKNFASLPDAEFKALASDIVKSFGVTDYDVVEGNGYRFIVFTADQGLGPKCRYATILNGHMIYVYADADAVPPSQELLDTLKYIALSIRHDLK